MPVPTGQPVQEMNLVILQVMWTPCDRSMCRVGLLHCSTLQAIFLRCRLLTQVDRFRLARR